VFFGHTVSVPYAFFVQGRREKMMTTGEYRLLWNAVTDAIRQLEAVREQLVTAQQRAEELILEKDCEIIVLPKSNNE